MSLDDGTEDGDLGLGFGLKPGSLMRPEDAPFRYCKRLFEEAQNVTSKELCDVKNDEEHLDSEKRSNLISAFLDINKKSNVFRKREFSSSEEIELLNYELDSLRRQLLSKQQAIKILQQEVKCREIRNEELEKKLDWILGTLIKDFNFLQFSVERERLVTSESREILAAKIDHLEAENKCLKAAIERQREELNSYKYLCFDQNFRTLFTGTEMVINCSKENDRDCVVEPRCFCNEYGRCPCAVYSERLVGVLRNLDGELKELRDAKRKCQDCDRMLCEDHPCKTGDQSESQISSNALASRRGIDSLASEVGNFPVASEAPADIQSVLASKLPAFDVMLDCDVTHAAATNCKNLDFNPSGEVFGSLLDRKCS